MLSHDPARGSTVRSPPVRRCIQARITLIKIADVRLHWQRVRSDEITASCSAVEKSNEEAAKAVWLKDT